MHFLFGLLLFIIVVDFRLNALEIKVFVLWPRDNFGDPFPEFFHGLSLRGLANFLILSELHIVLLKVFLIVFHPLKKIEGLVEGITR